MYFWLLLFLLLSPCQLQKMLRRFKISLSKWKTELSTNPKKPGMEERSIYESRKPVK